MNILKTIHESKFNHDGQRNIKSYETHFGLCSYVHSKNHDCMHFECWVGVAVTLNIFILHKNLSETQNINKVLIFDVCNLLVMQNMFCIIIILRAIYCFIFQTERWGFSSLKLWTFVLITPLWTWCGIFSILHLPNSWSWSSIPLGLHWTRGGRFEVCNDIFILFIVPGLFNVFNIYTQYVCRVEFLPSWV